MNEWIQYGVHTHTYIEEHYLTIKKEILIFVKTQMNPEGIIILSEISQTEKDKYRMISLICGI